MLPRGRGGGRGRGRGRGAGPAAAPAGVLHQAAALLQGLPAQITLLQTAVAPIPQIQAGIAGFAAAGAVMQADIAGLVTAGAAMQADIAGLVAAGAVMQANVAQIQTAVVGIQAVLGLGPVAARQLELRRINQRIGSSEPLCPLPDGGAVYPPAFWPAGLSLQDIAVLPPPQVNAMLVGYGIVPAGPAAVRKQALVVHLRG